MSENVREVLEDAWLAIHHEGYAPEDERDTCRQCDRFRQLLFVEAYTEAALMLVPDGWSWSIGELRGIGEYCAFLNDHNTPDGKAVRHVCKDNKHHPALAITQAALAAKGTGDE